MGNKMMNTKGAVDLAERPLDRGVIAMTNCYRICSGQGLLFTYDRYRVYTFPVAPIQR